MINWTDEDNNGLKRHNAISILLRQHEYLLEFLFDPKKPQLRTNTDVMKRRLGVLSSGELVLAKIALDFWSDSGGATISELHRLDPTNIQNFIDGFCYLTRGQ